MKAAILYGTNDLRIEDITVSDPGPGQVRVRMSASGICQTQLLEVRGRKGEDKYLPHLLGHEGAGTVVAIGPDVTKVKPGDRVMLSWIKGSGQDVRGGTYASGNGPVYAGPVVTFAEEVVVSENRVTSFAGNMPFEQAALIACAVATGAGTVLNVAQVRKGQSVTVFGLGGVGLAAIAAARYAGASLVVAVDVRDDKLVLSKTFGATHTFRASEAEQGIASLDGVDVAIDASGNKQAMEACVRVVKPNGGLAVIAGNLPAGTTISIDPFGLIQGRRLIGSWGGGTDPDRDFQRYVALAEQGVFHLADLISHHIQLEELPQTLDALERGEVTRAVIIF